MITGENVSRWKQVYLRVAIRVCGPGEPNLYFGVCVWVLCVCA